MRPRLAPLAAFALLAACAQPSPPTGPQPDLRILQRFPAEPRPAAVDYTVDGRLVHAVQMPGGPARVLFLHGTPGQWDNWGRYLDDARLQARATLIAVDRPGFGGSGRGSMAPALSDQSRLLAPLLGQAGEPKTWLVGHSLGGPIAAKMAMDHPDRVAGVVMIAPSIAAKYEQPRWFNHLADTWLARSLSGTWLQRQFADDDLYNSNAEIMPLAAELIRIEADWSRLKMPLIVVQGGQDTLVDPRTADWAEATLPKSNTRVIRLAAHDHFLIWSDYPLCSGLLIDLLDQPVH